MMKLTLLEMYIDERINTLDNTLLTTDYTDNTDNENERWKGLK